MKTKILIILSFTLFVIGCKTIELSKGKFIRGKVLKNEKFFVHDRHQKTNGLIKTGDTSNYGYGYYSWKTIKTAYTLKNDSALSNALKKDSTLISVYTTITNDSLLKFKNDKLAYIKKEKNVQINNLYFIDDYRFIYLSYDDNRIKDTVNIIPLFFDKQNYKIDKKLKKRFEQYLRGYYTIKDDKIFFHFESPYQPQVNYFVKGKIENNFRTIKFLSMTVPNSPNELYEEGYNAALKEFQNIFHKDAQPIFETVEPISDVIFIPQNYISLGFELNKNKNKLNSLHKRIIDKYQNELLVNDTLILGKVIYYIDNENEENTYRTYLLYRYKDPKRELKYTVDEYIGLDEKQNPIIIYTW